MSNTVNRGVRFTRQMMEGLVGIVDMAVVLGGNTDTRLAQGYLPHDLPVDLSKLDDFETTITVAERIPTPWEVMRGRARFPSLMEVVLRASMLHSTYLERAAVQDADLCLRPPVDHFSLMDFPGWPNSWRWVTSIRGRYSSTGPVLRLPGPGRKPRRSPPPPKHRCRKPALPDPSSSPTLPMETQFNRMVRLIERRYTSLFPQADAAIALKLAGGPTAVFGRRLKRSTAWSTRPKRN